jgi:hypothetical protein
MPGTLRAENATAAQAARATDRPDISNRASFIESPIFGIAQSLQMYDFIWISFLLIYLD